MPTKNIFLRSVEIDNLGNINVKHVVQVVDDDGTILVETPHRAVVREEDLSKVIADPTLESKIAILSNGLKTKGPIPKIPKGAGVG